MDARRSLREGGFTLAELAFGLMVFAIAATVMINHLQVNYSSTRDQKDRVFAFAKAQALLSEIQSYVDRGEIQAAIDLDALDDGTVSKPTLTITTDRGKLVAPDHPLSGNTQRDGRWVWGRRITVKPFSGLQNRNVRYVTVRIYKRDGNGVERPMADLSSVVNSIGSAFPSTQVYDLYLLAVENIPGWWVYMESIIPFVESAITDLESRNPGLRLRTHWITKAAYGRNPVYRPYINEANDSLQPVTSVYYYPGRMPAGSASTFYYVPDLIKARMSFDGVEKHGYDADRNPYPYALADFYNHAMRYPRELAYHERRVQAVVKRKQAIEAARRAGLPEPPELDDMSEEPTLRLFFEDLCTNPDKYRHALIINLHGELIPMPSLRNYSDAAKAPDLLPNVRVVTHPEELRTKRDPLTGIDDVKLRVYAYRTDPDAPGLQVMPSKHPIAIQIMGVDLTDASSPSGLMAGAEILRLPGGVPVGGDDRYYPFGPAKTKAQGPQPNEMHYEVSFVDPGPGEEKFTLVKLYHTPVVAPAVAGRGLDNDKRSRLYGLEYVPSCTEAALDFSRDLYAKGNGPKNTARWVVRVPGTVFAAKRFVDSAGNRYDPADDVVLTVRTRIWDPDLPDPLASGTMWPNPIEPENLSETYTWWADSREDVPMTERAQFQGDPRHNPYKDLWHDDPDFGDGYCWYHDSLRNNSENAVADFPGIDSGRLRNRWRGSMRQDVPRFFELLRTGLIRSGAVYSSMTGFSYYYMAHGNEIGYDSANGYPSSIPVNSGPWWIDTTTTGYANNITGARCYVRNVAAPYWMGLTWLGELYPDDVYKTQWIALDGAGKVRGNLDAGQGMGADKFVRWPDQDCYANSQNLAYGTALYSAKQRTSTKGCTSFFNSDNAPGKFTHVFAGGDGTLFDAGPEVANGYNFPIPTTTPINRPFTLYSGTSGADEWNYDPYRASRCTSQVVHQYYKHPNGVGSGLVQLVDKDDTSAAYIVVNGIAQTVSSGSAFIAKYSLLTMLHSFFEAGDKGLKHRIRMPARVEIEAPTEITELQNPASIQIRWSIEWKRWDGKPYAAGMAGHVEDESDMEYVLMYSKDAGRTWLYVQDDSPARPGVKPSNPLYVVPDKAAGDETYVWPTPPSSFVEGSYLIHIDGYRRNQSLHYSQHRVKIYIDR